ncbi:MAG: cupin domain-containing protein [Candidatus Omnitrophica bacterium]|nr:cupin domain-containing protein [Candidatus Omnitrophota bacterium]
MNIKRLLDCPEFIAGDGTNLRELFHASKGDFKFRYSLARAVVKEGRVSKPHRLKTSEVYHIIEGRGRMHIGKESSKVGPGDSIYIPPHSIQYIENIGHGDLVFLCIVDPAWRAEDEEMV